MAASTSEEKQSKRFMDQWLDDDDVAAKYARAEKATKPFAEIMLQKAGVSGFTGNEQILDIATGTGAVIAALHEAVGKEKQDGLKIVAGDISDSMLEYVGKRAERDGWKGVDLRKINGVDVGTDETFTHIFVNFAIFILTPDSISKCIPLLRTNGFLGVSSWASFSWWPLVERAHARLSNPPPLPSSESIKQRMYQGRSWSVEYIREELEKAGFKDVDVVQEKRAANIGTPAQFAETMTMPLRVVGAGWPEEDKDRLLKEMHDALEAVATEDAGGAEGTFDLICDGIVGVGRKP